MMVIIERVQCVYVYFSLIVFALNYGSVQCKYVKGRMLYSIFSMDAEIRQN
jgi:hypothetical protein